MAERQICTETRTNRQKDKWTTRQLDEVSRRQTDRNSKIKDRQNQTGRQKARENETNTNPIGLPMLSLDIGFQLTQLRRYKWRYQWRFQRDFFYDVRRESFGFG